MITVSVAIGDSDQPTISGYAISLKTPAGEIHVGIDNNGRTYLSSGSNAILLRPLSSNRVLFEVEK